MDKQQFYKYIDESYNKAPGTYTENELYEIGCMHKKLAKNDKNWNELAGFVGFKGNGESYRGYVNRRQLNEGSLKIADEELVLEDPDSYSSLYAQKTQIRDIYNAYRADIRTEARKESFLETLKDVAKAMPAIKFNVAPSARKFRGGNEAVLMLSDLHIGVSCSNFYNTYNTNVAKERLEKLACDVADYCERFDVSVLHVANLGDMIAGYIHVTGRIQNELDVAHQVLTAADLITRFLASLRTQLPDIEITYRSCTDNHSRMIPNYKDNIEEENFSILIDALMEARLANTDADILFMKDNLDPSIMHFTVGDKEILAAHGHLEKPDKCIDGFTGAIKKLPDFVLLSHYHQGRMKAYNGSKLFINGSIVGSEQYAVKNRLFNPAEQKLLIFDKDNVIDLNINLQ